MIDASERRLSRALRAALTPLNAGDAIPESTHFREVLQDLEDFVPTVLAGVDPSRYVGLDGVIPLQAHKTAEGEAEILGLCILIEDQSVTPIHLRIQVAEAADEISWMECRFGQAGPAGMRTWPYDRLTEASKELYVLNSPVDEMDWAFHIGFGEKR